MIQHASAAVAGWLHGRQLHGEMLVALDFDGTLSPIAPRPEEAFLPADTRATLADLAARVDTRVAVVSGRALADVRGRVAINTLYYAGNHGLEIDGPGLARCHEQALASRPALLACLARLESAIGAMPGVVLENKGLTLSVHYRLAGDALTESAVRQAVIAACGSDPALRMTQGKKVVEVRPAVDWDKGRTIVFLASSLLEDVAAPVLFIGDDVTDEDGFRALAGRGDGVLVADPPPPGTAATFYLRSPAEVAVLLRALAQDGTATV